MFPSLTLFEVALFIDLRDVGATYCPPPTPSPLSPSPPGGPGGARGAMLTY